MTKVTLGAGGTETLIHVCVTPENQAAADTKVYAITVYRERANLNIDADAECVCYYGCESGYAVSLHAVVTSANGEACGPDTARVACDLLGQIDADSELPGSHGFD